MTRRHEGSAQTDLSTLRAALGASMSTPFAASHATGFTRWENEGGTIDTLAAQEARDRALAASERTAWAADAAALVDVGDVDVAMRVYTRGLRRDRAGLAATLAAVRAVVAECLTPRLSHDGLAAVQRDAARACLQAYFGP